ncbi:MAG: alpha/beta hydrolase [Culicoidibacterales bacterium]
MKPTTKTLLPALATTTIITGIIGISYTIAHQLTHPKRSSISVPPNQAALIYEDISVSTPDQLNIKGWFLPAQNNGQEHLSQQTIIFAHHYGGSRTSDELGSLEFFKNFLPKGYNIIAFDFRNSGLSDGDMTTMGVSEQDDLAAIVAWCNQRIPNGQIVLWGFSMGAAVSLNSGWQFANVVGVIADSSFSDLSRYCLEALEAWAPVNPLIFSYPVFLISQYVLGIKAEKMSPLKAIKNYESCQLLLIHSHKDRIIPVQHAMELYAAANPNTCELCIFPSENHAASYFTNSDLYLQKVFAFLQRSFQTAALSPLTDDILQKRA